MSIWGISLNTLNNWSVILLIIGLCGGGVGIVASSISSYISMRTSDLVQNDANAKIKSAETVIENLKNENISLQRTLEKERAERLEREAMAASRMPKSEQFSYLNEKIKPETSVPQLRIITVNDPESAMFGLWIYNSLFNMANKMSMSEVGIDSDIGRFHKSGLVLYSFNEKNDNLAAALKEAKLIDGVIDLSKLPSEKSLFGFPRDSDTLVVGRKEPIPPVGMTPLKAK